MIPYVLAVNWGEFMPFIMIMVVVAIVFWFLLNKKRLEHQQIMAAIEKGTPLSELRPVEQPTKQTNWIKSLCGGIMFLLMGIGLSIIIFYVKPVRGPLAEDPGFGLFIAVIFLAIGIAKIIRGILQRKDDKEKSALDTKNGQ